MDLNLDGKKVVVTGGSRGLGRAIVEQFLAEGAEVSTCARGEAGLAQALDEMRAAGGKVHGAALDVRDAAAKRKVYRDTLRELAALSPRDLNDLGLNRSMLKGIAYQAAYEK